VTNDANTNNEETMNEQVTQTQVRAPWVFGARDNRHRGVEVDNEGQLLTTAQAISQGGLDWMVELRPIVSDDEDAHKVENFSISMKIENVLEDGELVRVLTDLGIVGSRYTVLQNRDAFKFFDRATLEGAAVIKAVGHLDHGRVVWAVAQRPETIEIAPGDVIHQNMVLVTAHDGSHAAKVLFAPYRPATGTMLGVKGTGRVRTQVGVKVRHTASIDERMLDLHNVLAAESGYFERWRAALLGTDEKQGFKQKIVTDDQIKKVVAGLFPAQKKLDEDGNKIEVVSGKAEKARQLIAERIEEQQARSQAFYDDAGQQAPNGTTQLDVFLGVSEYIDKDRTVRNEGNNWVASTFGTGAGARQKAFDLISGL
jgi:phage/plasmid-like protein (TIGR03299 family)